MIVHLPPSSSQMIASALGHRDFFYSVYPNREMSRTGLDNRLAATGNAVVDFEWHSPSDEDAGWVTDTYGDRDQLRARSDKRGDFMVAVRALTQAPFLAPGGRPDRVADSLRFARDAVDALPHGTPVWATVTLTRPGITDPQVVMQMNQLHRDISGIYLVVHDNAGFPAAWSAEELLEYLKLIGSQSLAGREVVAAHSHVRGLLATALGTAHVGTGVFKSMKQYGSPRSGGGAQPGQGPQPTASYLSLPLLAILHGENAEAILGADIQHVESHDRSLPNCRLRGLPASGDAWDAWRNPDGNANVSRGLLGIRAMAAAESELLASGNPADLMEAWLDEAARIAQRVSSEAFQTAGLRAEVLARPDVFRQARAFLVV